MSSTESYPQFRYRGIVKKIKRLTSERTAFAQRLNQALNESSEQIPQEGKGRQSVVGQLFGVDQKAARKWLKGEGFPTLEKCTDIAKRLNVSMEWLLTGRGDKRIMDNLNAQLAELLNVYWQLPNQLQGDLMTYARFLLETKNRPPAASQAFEKEKPKTISH